MKYASIAILIVFGVLRAMPAFANSDDAKWVSQCISDNKDEKAGIDVITKYCTCMNNKMDSNETASITAWEKTHATERHACDQEAGWK
jgi:hypothetical protein